MRSASAFRFWKALKVILKIFDRIWKRTIESSYQIYTLETNLGSSVDEGKISCGGRKIYSEKKMIMLMQRITQVCGIVMRWNQQELVVIWI